jgi:hypothetical protein
MIRSFLRIFYICLRIGNLDQDLPLLFDFRKAHITGVRAVNYSCVRTFLNLKFYLR